MEVWAKGNPGRDSRRRKVPQSIITVGVRTEGREGREKWGA